jgi:hypothetical protein
VQIGGLVTENLTAAIGPHPDTLAPFVCEQDLSVLILS